MCFFATYMWIGIYCFFNRYCYKIRFFAEPFFNPPEVNRISCFLLFGTDERVATIRDPGISYMFVPDHGQSNAPMCCIRYSNRNQQIIAVFFLQRPVYQRDYLNLWPQEQITEQFSEDLTIFRAFHFFSVAVKKKLLSAKILDGHIVFLFKFIIPMFVLNCQYRNVMSLSCKLFGQLGSSV